jgi:hypothetical protein
MAQSAPPRHVHAGMKTIRKNEIFRNLGSFLKSKGVELTDGSYTETIRSVCTTLTDAVNTTQATVRGARGKIDRHLDQLRQSIHERTAPQPPLNQDGARATNSRPPSPRRAAPQTNPPRRRASPPTASTPPAEAPPRIAKKPSPKG